MTRALDQVEQLRDLTGGCWWTRSLTECHTSSLPERTFDCTDARPNRIPHHPDGLRRRSLPGELRSMIRAWPVDREVAVDDRVAHQLPAVVGSDDRAASGQIDHGCVGERVGAIELRRRPLLDLGDHGETRYEPEPERVGAAAPVGHRVAQRRSAGARSNHHAVAFEHPGDRPKERCLLQHAAQMDRRVAGQEHRVGTGDRGRGRIVGLRACEDHQRVDLHPEPTGPRRPQWRPSRSVARTRPQSAASPRATPATTRDDRARRWRRTRPPPCNTNIPGMGPIVGREVPARRT